MSDNYRLNYRGLQTYDSNTKEYIDKILPKVMNGATRFSNGTEGIVPTPIAGDNKKYLKGDGTWAEVPSFLSLYDYNKEEIYFAQNEIQISSIECHLNKKVDLEGHLTMSLYTTEACNITIRIKDDNNSELFTPQTHFVRKGYNKIDIPHAYFSRIIGTHYFTVTAQCSNGAVCIPTRGLLYTVFGSIDDTYDNIGIDIIDLAIKQTSVGESPSDIYTLGFEDNHLLLRKNNYNSPNDNQWKELFDFGEAKGGSLEFYGTWYEDDRTGKSTLITKEEPFIFIIDKLNQLICYSDGNYEEGTIIASDVSKSSACIGYKSNVADLEQGLVVAFLKNGNVYYKQYINGEWYAYESLYEDGDAINVQIHRLPDYRLGIIVQTLLKKKWFITDRTFIGDTYKKEFVNIDYDIFNVVTMVPLERINDNIGKATQNEFSEENTHHNGFIMEFEHDLIFTNGKTIDDFKKTITITHNGTNITSQLDTLEIDGNKIIIYLKQPVLGNRDLVISYNFNYLIQSTYNNSLSEITKTYTWHLPIPTIRNSYKENVNINTDMSSNINMLPIITKSFNIEDEIVEIGTNMTSTIDMLPISKNNINAEEELIDVGVDMSSSIDMILISVTPI